MSSVRPAYRRRSVPPEELAALAGMDVADLERRLRGLGNALASWTGSGWRLSDPGWRELLGPDFAEQLARAAGVPVPVVRQPKNARPRKTVRQPKKDRRFGPRPFDPRDDLHIVASFWGGEDPGGAR